MNFGRCLEIALVKHQKKNVWLADKIGLTPTRIGHLRKSQHVNTVTLEKCANAFGMTVVEFLQLEEKIDG